MADIINEVPKDLMQTPKPENEHVADEISRSLGKLGISNNIEPPHTTVDQGTTTPVKGKYGRGVVPIDTPGPQAIRQAAATQGSGVIVLGTNVYSINNQNPTSK